MYYREDVFLQSPHQKHGPFETYYWYHCHMARDLIWYLIATWPSFNIFLQDINWISVKRNLVKIKGVHFSFFTFSRSLAMALSFFHILKFINLVVDYSPKYSMFNYVQMGYCHFTNTLGDVPTAYVICLRRNDS